MIPRHLLNYFNVKVIKYLCNGIDDLYIKMMIKFPIEQESLDVYINFSTNFVSNKYKNHLIYNYNLLIFFLGSKFL